MRELKSNELGYYVPSFFEMHINTNNDDMQITGLSDKDRLTLFHEYVHFLQDFTTIFGLNNLYVYSEYFRSVANRIYNSDSKEFPIPYIIEDNNDNVLLNQMIHCVANGDSEQCNHFEIENIEIDDLAKSNELIRSALGHPLYGVNLYSSNDARTFGALAIMESMAYIMEQCCSRNFHVPSPDFPYSSAEKVANFYVPNFSSNLPMLLALCDMSLQCSNPGFCFIRIMQKTKSRELDFKNPEDVYNYFYTLRHSLLNVGECSFVDVFKNCADRVTNNLKSYLQNAPITDSYHKWIDSLFEFAVDWRENDRCFLLKMASREDLSSNNGGYAVARVGTPLMSNMLDHYFYIPPVNMGENDAVTYFKALFEIEKVFRKGSCTCSMYKWCSDSFSTSTPNELCKTAPWEKVSEEMLCPVAFIWKHWNLSKHKPKVEK